ncbi:hypothetical protein GCM10017161_34730 [Thalassotalea marina]|uniref:10TM heavy-metal exporter n=2 Tax=Thalassotalea marina TaxID=1673741 RepID=A0A919BN89_9GAMM|nr:hypothetical protein GCM10017161_34730 [Thalassotalea marina]
MSDAFWQVAVFVALTLIVYHLVAHRVSLIARQKSFAPTGPWKIVLASFMGVIPGCGGAIIVITQFVSGSMSFGAIVAVLTATMGDAAFLLLAAQPETGLFVIILSFSVGIISGLIVDRIHGQDFLKPALDCSKEHTACRRWFPKQSKRIKSQGLLWQWLVIPGAVVGLFMAAQQDVETWFFISDNTIQVLGALIVLVFIVLWATTTEVKDFESIVAEDKKSTHSKTFQRVALDTNFITSWVVIAFLMFELLVFYTKLDLTQVFTAIPSLLPFIGVVIGMIPGCGPQIITTTLYLSGAIPLSAQIGNAISNDGDALFPAIALSPKVAIMATLYSSIPAFVVAYGYYFIFEV